GVKRTRLAHALSIVAAARVACFAHPSGFDRAGEKRTHHGRRSTLIDRFEALLREEERAFQPGDLETAPTEELIALAGATLAQQMVLILRICDDLERPKQTVLAEAVAIMRLQPLAKLAAVDERAPQIVRHVLAEQLAVLEWFSSALGKR